MLQLEVWRVHDTGLVAAPGRFRRLPGAVRHHRPEGDDWPAEAALVLDGGTLVVTGPGGLVGSWPEGEVRVERVAEGPPVTFVLVVPGSAQLLAAPATPATATFLDALARPAP